MKMMAVAYAAGLPFSFLMGRRGDIQLGISVAEGFAGTIMKRKSHQIIQFLFLYMETFFYKYFLIER